MFQQNKKPAAAAVIAIKRLRWSTIVYFSSSHPLVCCCLLQRHYQQKKWIKYNAGDSDKDPLFDLSRLTPDLPSPEEEGEYATRASIDSSPDTATPTTGYRSSAAPVAENRTSAAPLEVKPEEWVDKTFKRGSRSRIFDCNVSRWVITRHHEVFQVF